MLKGNLSVQFTRVQEKLENLISSNNDVHNQLLQGQKDLCEKVNKDIDNVNKRLNTIEIYGTAPIRELTQKLYQLVENNEKRIRTLENQELTESAKYKGRMELFRWISIALTLIISAGGVLHLLGLF